MSARRRGAILLTGLFVATFVVRATVADDWPTYLHDNARSGATAESVKTPLVPLWTFTPTAPPDPAWTQPSKEAARVRFDDAYHVVVADGRVFFGSSGDNKVYALDALSGEVIWSLFTDGPVRVAPTVADDRVYFGSDDGHAYCVNAADGSLVWKVRAGDFDDRVIGHQRVISLWPVRSGVIVDGGVAYFAAGVFPNEGIYICAVDAVTGKSIWRNDTTGEFGPEQQFDGISPQGPMLASRDTLYVASGRSMPAGFARSDGKFKFYLNPGGKVGGAYALLTEDEHLVAGVNEQRTYDADSGETTSGSYAWSPAHRLIVHGDVSYSLGDHEVSALDRTRYEEVDKKRATAKAELEKTRNAMRTLYRERYFLDDKLADYQAKYDDYTARIKDAEKQLKDLQAGLRDIEAGAYSWKVDNKNRHSMVLAGDVLFTGGDDKVDAISAKTGEWLWSGDVVGRAAGLAVADGRLFVSTAAGRIHCFAPGSPAYIDSRVALDVVRNPYPQDELTRLYRRAAEEIVSRSGVDRGFCLVVGCGEGRLALELARRTNLNIYAIDDDPELVARARQMLDRAGVYGSRVTVDEGSLVNLPYPTYFANLIVSDDLLVDGAVEASAEEVFRVLKPQGGVLMLGQPELARDGAAENAVDEGVTRIDVDEVKNWLSTSDAPQPEITADRGRWVRLVRGALKGAGSWTHQYGNPANTSNSNDELVKTPLGVLWYGRPGPERMVERHARAAAPVSLDGRLFVEGENVVMAYDAYNGALLWERDIPGAVRVRVDADGSNMAVSRHGLFVATRDKALRLDPASGETLSEYRCPPSTDGTPRRWGILYAIGDTLYGTLAKPLDHEYGAEWQNPTDDPIDNLKAYHAFSAAGGMWRTMLKWPAWGREDTWKGAVTGHMLYSDAVFALDVATGQPRWIYHGEVCPTTMCFGDNVLFLADNRVSDAERLAAVNARREKYGLLTHEDPDKDAYDDFDVRHMMAIDATTGDVVWERYIDVTGSGGDRMGTVYYQGQLFIFGNFSNHDGSAFSKGELAWRRVTVVSGDDGSDRWSKELNYLRRPFIIGSQLVVEPRAVDLTNGEFKTRVHPITGDIVPWEFFRGGHSCGVCTASDDTFFFRSYSINYYDMSNDSGMLPVGATRAGCWINMIPCNGLALIPEASAGCTCSFPVRTTMCMVPKERDRAWSIFASPGAQTPVEHWFINLGAPGDRKDAAGNVWFNYPRLKVGYGMQFKLGEGDDAGLEYFARAFDARPIGETDLPWVLSSGVTGAVNYSLKLLDEGHDAAKYTVRLLFCEPVHDAAGARTFDISLQGKVVAKDFDIVREAGGRDVAYTATFSDFPVSGNLEIKLTGDTTGGEDTAPLLNGIEVLRQDK